MAIVGKHVSTLTTDCKPANLFSGLNLNMATLQERLEEVMTSMGWTHGDVVRISGQSSSVVSQWRGKGTKLIKSIGKMEAAMRLSAASGYSALWIAEGEGPKMSVSYAKEAAAKATIAAEPPPVPLSAPVVLEHLAMHLQQLAPDLRPAAGDLLAGLATDPLGPGRVALLCQLLSSPPNHSRRAA